MKTRQRSSKRSEQKIYVADFETTTDPADCRVWAWGMVDIEKTRSAWHVEIDKDIHSFFDRAQSEDAVIYFHNLRFDGSFIIDALFRKGYVFIEDGNRLRPGQFSAIINGQGQWYRVTVVWDNGKKTEFRDSLKKIRLPVKQIARTFGMYEKKGRIDYDAHRPVGHVITREERSYIINDVLIVAKAVKNRLDAGMTKLTSSADALAEFKKLTGKNFTDLFPILSTTMDGEIRDAYRGGFTYLNPKFKGRILGKGKTFDVNSLYPSVMYDRLLPYGEPVFRQGMPKKSAAYPLFIVSITFTAKIKPGHVPCIQIKNSRFHNDVEYLEEIAEPVTLACSNVDLELWQDHYDLDILSANGGWAFKGMTGVFCKYIDKWMKVKEESEGGTRSLAKGMLNDLYGKFATNPDVTPNIPRLEDDVVRFKLGTESIRNPVYTAMGVFITSYAREKTIRAAQQYYDVFAYADTDSLHLVTTDNTPLLDVHPTKMGAWKHEYDFQSAFFARPKGYAERHNVGECHTKEHEECWEDNHDYCHEHREGGCYEVHISGMPVEVAQNLTFDDFTNGRHFDGNLKSKRVPGGVVLFDSGFTLKF